LTIALLWFTSIPLGIPGEWTWERTIAEPDLFWNLCGGVVAAALFIAFVRQGWCRFELLSGKGFQGLEITAWLLGLVIFSFAWLWVVREITPVTDRLGKAAFVLYYPSSSGYFTRARYDQPNAAKMLAGYEALMREGDVLHTGTHPPGLILAFYGLIAACDQSDPLSSFLDATQPYSFREATEVIAANGLRRKVPRPLLPLDRRVLWLATLLVMLSASLTVIPLFGLLRRSVSIQTAWAGAVVWPALPAVAIFIPKSDVMFAFIGVTLLWLWLTAWDRRSLILAFLSGLVAWLGLLCSLAFLPVLLLAAIMTLGVPFFRAKGATPNPDVNDMTSLRTNLRLGLCLLVAAAGFFLPIYLFWKTTHANLLAIWWLNYQNHAGFYQHFPRTWWKWLLVNPMELSFSAGWPAMMLAIAAVFHVLRPSGSVADSNDHRRRLVVYAILAVWGFLWLTGKNSGEAARLWILFLPWLVWLASIQMSDLTMAGGVAKPENRRGEPQVLFLLAMQFLVCLLTVVRVSGFHNETGNAG
jgi:hypothetical protein